MSTVSTICIFRVLSVSTAVVILAAGPVAHATGKPGGQATLWIAVGGYVVAWVTILQEGCLLHNDQDFDISEAESKRFVGYTMICSASMGILFTMRLRGRGQLADVTTGAWGVDFVLPGVLVFLTLVAPLSRWFAMRKSEKSKQASLVRYVVGSMVIGFGLGAVSQLFSDNFLLNLAFSRQTSGACTAACAAVLLVVAGHVRGGRGAGTTALKQSLVELGAHPLPPSGAPDDHLKDDTAYQLKVDDHPTTTTARTS